MNWTLLRNVGRFALPAALPYALMLATGRAVLVPVVFVGLILTFRALFRAGCRLAPFAVTLVVLAIQNLGAGVVGGSNAGQSLHAAIALSAIAPLAILFGGWWADPVASHAWVRKDLRGVELWIVTLALAYAAVVALRWLSTPVPLGLAIPSLRNALTPAYALLVVLLLPPRLRPAVDQVGQWLGRWGVLIAAFGVLEFVVLRDRFWAKVAHIGAVIDVKRLSTARIHGLEVPADFYTHFGHNYFRRLVSVYGDAITTSCYLALGLLAIVVLWRRPRRWQVAALAFLIPALLLGAAKGAFGIVVIGLLIAWVAGSRFRYLLPSGAVVVLGACIACVVFGWATQFVPWNSSADLHVDGISSAVREVTQPLDGSALFGDGVGTGGSGAVYANRVVDGHTPEARDVPGLDNGAGAILAQTGVLGLGLLLAIFASVIDTTLRRAQDSRGVVLALAAITALLCNFLLQEHALTLVTSLPFWILGAVAVRAAEPFGAASPGFMPRMRRVSVESVDLDFAMREVPAASEPQEELQRLVDALEEAERAEEPQPEPEPQPESEPAVPDWAGPGFDPAPVASPSAYVSLTEEPVPTMIHLAERGPAGQVDDDPELLDLMLGDLAAAPAVFQPLRSTAQAFQARINELRDGLRDFRQRPWGRGRGGTALMTGVEALPALENALASCRAAYARLSDLESVDDLDVSRVGDPFGFEADGRFLTPEALTAYRRYAFVNEFVDVREMDLVVMLGADAATQAEVLKQLYPFLTIVIADQPANLYVAERFLSAARPDDVVPYRTTRGEGTPELKRRKIHFVGHHRLGELPRTKRQLVWVAGYFDDLDNRTARGYGEWLTNAGDYLYMSAQIDGDFALHERTQEQVLTGFHLVERRTAPDGSDDTFWKRRRKL